MLNHITVFPADRPGMPLFVLFLLFSAFLECQITQCARGNVRFHHHPKVFLFAALVLLAAMVSSTRAWDGLNNCLVVEVKWLCRNHVMLCSLCFLHFTHSSFVFCACKWTNAVSQNCHRMVSILRRVTSQKQYSPAPLGFIKLTAIISVYICGTIDNRLIHPSVWIQETLRSSAVSLLNLIKQWDQWKELRLELSQPHRGLFILLPNLTGSRVSMHHTQENSKQLPDSRSHSSPPLNLPPYTLLLHAVYKKHIALLEPLSKSFRSHCEAPHFLLSLRREM